jgi:hypothetical protein
MSEAELMQHAMRLSRLELERAGGAAPGPPEARPPPTQEELDAQARQRAKLAEESRQRQRLRDEQATEYEESLRADQLKEAEKLARQREEEEAAQVEARKAAEEAAAEEARKAKAAALVEEARQQLSVEPADDDTTRVQVALRLPDGRRLKRAFLPDDEIAQIYHYALVEGGEVLARQDFRIIATMPRRIYEDRSAKLAAEELKGQCALLIEIMEPDD